MSLHYGESTLSGQPATQKAPDQTQSTLSDTQNCCYVCACSLVETNAIKSFYEIIKKATQVFVLGFSIQMCFALSGCGLEIVMLTV